MLWLSGVLGLLGMAIWMAILGKLEKFDDLPGWKQIGVAVFMALCLTTALGLLMQFLIEAEA